MTMNDSALRQYALTGAVKTAWLGHKDKGRCSNWSLQLDKFSVRNNPGDEHKRDALVEVASIFEKQSADMLAPTWLEQLKQQTPPLRWQELLLTNTSRVVVALARAHVLENVGLAHQPITGRPWIPGTAVKGVVSTWASWCGNVENPDEKNPDGTDADSIFRALFQTERRHLLPPLSAQALEVLGSDDAGSAQAGQVIFLGGFPAEPSALSLKVDVVTPHAAKKDPVPSFFLTVAAGGLWRFPLLASPRCPAERAPDLLKTAADWLRAALEQSGLGAKTAAGYGRFAEAPAGASATTPIKAGAGGPPMIAPVTAETYEAFLVRMKNRWVQLAENPDALKKLSAADRAHAVRFFVEETGLMERNRWGKPENINRRTRESNLRAAKLLEDE